MTRNSHTGKRFLQTLAIVLALMLSFVFPALAEEASTWESIRTLVGGGSTVSITLTDDIIATDSWTLVRARRSPLT